LAVGGIPTFRSQVGKKEQAKETKVEPLRQGRNTTMSCVGRRARKKVFRK